MGLFPNTFDLRNMRGLRARQFDTASEAFQELVGDGLRETRHPGVSVAPTVGSDGAIDAHIDLGPKVDNTWLSEFPKPIIIECKHHHKGTPKEIKSRLDASWQKTRRVLIARSAAGWPEPSQPWKDVRTYLYCVSCRIPNTEIRSQFEQAVSDCIKSIAPSVEYVKILDWADLSALWRNTPRLADLWLGLHIGNVRSHAEAIEDVRYRGFRQLLLESHLPYFAPDPSDPCHPDRIFDSLFQESHTDGVLIVGPGGIGKTRLLFEVGSRAEMAGCRVLHYLPGERQMSSEELSDLLLTDNTRTLLLVDYLDQCQANLELTNLRSTLIPQLRARGSDLALLACARPLFASIEDADRDQVFRQVRLDPPSDFKSLIVDHIGRSIAAHATKRFGLERMRRILGNRPIIAMFIAREVESLMQRECIDPNAIADGQRGDLTTWLIRRLRESGLRVPASDSPLRPAQLMPELIAAAAVLGAAPQRRHQLTLVARTCLANESGRPPEAYEEVATYVVDSLLDMGWLEERDADLHVAHDVVADVVLRDVLTIHRTGQFRESVHREILAPTLASPRTFGRLATSYGRIIHEDFGQEESSLEDAVIASCSKWFAEHNYELRKVYLDSDPDETAYAIGAAVAAPPWKQILFERADELLAPWLEKHVESPAARHLLHRSLHSAAHGQGGRLIAASTRWLQRYGETPQAEFVMGAVFDRSELSIMTPELGELASIARRWLAIHVSRRTAGYVLAPLLRRMTDQPQAIDVELRGEIVQAALSWCATHYELHGSWRTLLALIEHVSGDELRALLRQTLSWLSHHRERVEAPLVTSFLIRLPALDNPSRTTVREVLESHLTSGLSPWYAVETLCNVLSADIYHSPRLRRPAMREALRIIRNEPDFTKLHVLIRTLSNIRGLSKADKRLLAEQGWKLLPKQLDEDHSVYDILILLIRYAHHHTQDALGRALGWARVHVECEDEECKSWIGDVCADVAAHRDATEVHIADAVAVAHRWIQKQRDEPGFDPTFMFKDIFKADTVRDDNLRRLMVDYFEWLRAHPTLPHVERPLYCLLRRNDTPIVAKSAVSETLAWLATPMADGTDAMLATQFESYKIISGLLRSSHLNAEEFETTVHNTSTWLAAHHESIPAGGLISLLLKRSKHLKESVVLDLGRRATQWLQSRIASGTTGGGNVRKTLCKIRSRITARVPDYVFGLYIPSGNGQSGNGHPCLHATSLRWVDYALEQKAVSSSSVLTQAQLNQFFGLCEQGRYHPLHRKSRTLFLRLVALLAPCYSPQLQQRAKQHAVVWFTPADLLPYQCRQNAYVIHNLRSDHVWPEGDPLAECLEAEFPESLLDESPQQGCCMSIKDLTTYLNNCVQQGRPLDDEELREVLITISKRIDGGQGAKVGYVVPELIVLCRDSVPAMQCIRRHVIDRLLWPGSLNRRALVGMRHEFRRRFSEDEDMMRLLRELNLVVEKCKPQPVAVGQVRAGWVETIYDYGAFVNIDGIQGLVHKSNVSWLRLKHPAEQLFRGQHLKVKVLGVQGHHVTLGVRQLQPSPWLGAADRYQFGSEHYGQVCNIKDYGAFIRLPDGITGLVHISEMDLTHVHRIKEYVNIGDIVCVTVLEVDESEERLSLSMRRVAG